MPAPKLPSRAAPLATLALVGLALAGLVAIASRTRGASVARPHTMGADGLPALIPPPGSPRPSEAEWAAVTREIRVDGVPPLPCESKMLREWLRVSCTPAGGFFPKFVATLTSSGHDEQVGMEGEAAKLVVQVVRGARYQGRVVYATQRMPAVFSLVVEWPARQTRPTITFRDEVIDP